LDVIVTAPADLAGIRKRLIEAQDADGGEEADVDHIYDVPAELAKILTGFRHDQDTPGVTGDAYHILEPALRTNLASKFISMFKGKQ
jgi:hypothetical protein